MFRLKLCMYLHTNEKCDVLKFLIVIESIIFDHLQHYLLKFLFLPHDISAHAWYRFYIFSTLSETMILSRSIKGSSANALLEALDSSKVEPLKVLPHLLELYRFYLVPLKVFKGYS